MLLTRKELRWLPCIVLFLGWTTSPLLAQDETVPAVRDGFQLRTASAYATYFSNGAPPGLLQPGLSNLPPDGGFGGSAVLDWRRFTSRTTYTLSYTPSYTGRFRYSSLNALNHAFSLNITHKIVPRWNLGFSAGGNLSTLDQSIFAPTSLSNVASVPASFTDLAAALLSSKFTNNPQLGIALGSAPLVQSPLQTLLYGQRMFTSSAQASLSFSYSPRFSVTFTGGGSRTQNVSGTQSFSEISNLSNPYLLYETTSGNAGITASYSYSPVLQFGATANTTRISSSFQDAYISTALATVSRTFHRRWIVQFHGGVGVTTPVRQLASSIPTSGPGPALGGSLAYKTLSHTFLGSFDRTVSDAYGFGSSTSLTASAAWQWRRPGRSWWLTSGFARQQLDSTAFVNTSGWQVSAGFGQRINQHLTWLTEFAYLNYSGALRATAPYTLSQGSVRVTLIWTPSPARL